MQLALLRILHFGKMLVKTRAEGGKIFSIFLSKLYTKCQCHQHFTCSFYLRRSQKRKNNSQLKQFFALLGSAGVKIARKHVDEIDPSRCTSNRMWQHSAYDAVVLGVIHVDVQWGMTVPYALWHSCTCWSRILLRNSTKLCYKNIFIIFTFLWII